MTKPDHIRCETCVFWEMCDYQPEQPNKNGRCRLDPEWNDKYDNEFCSHWEGEWPGQEKDKPQPQQGKDDD